MNDPPSAACEQHTVCLEEMEGRWIAHVTTLPGCFSSAEDQTAAKQAVPDAIRRYSGWRKARGDSLECEPVGAIHIAEIVREWESPIDATYIVNAFFAADAVALSPADVQLSLRLLDWQRADLMTALEGLTREDLNRTRPNDWSIERLLGHVAGAEWWYLDRLGLACSREELANDWRGRLTQVRTLLRAALPELAGVAQIVWRSGEVWSARKLVRRALWHERDHTDHLLRLRSGSPT